MGLEVGPSIRFWGDDQKYTNKRKVVVSGCGSTDDSGQAEHQHLPHLGDPSFANCENSAKSGSVLDVDWYVPLQSATGDW